MPSIKTYTAIFVALMMLLAGTIGAYFVSLGAFNTIAALVIAAAKALLVILFFMRVRYSERVLWVFVFAGFFWLAILISLMLGDVLTRAATSGL